MVHVINKHSCRDNNLMFLICRLVLVCLEKTICFKAKHIAGVQNVLADALSWLKLQTIKEIALAFMNPHPTEIPLHLYHLSWRQGPPIICVLACNRPPFSPIGVLGSFL